MPNQKSDDGLRRIACLAAIFVPFATAGMLLKELSGVTVSPQSIWEWVQAIGQEMMKQLDAELTALQAGHEPEVEAMSAATAAETILMGADGVMVPFRPQAKAAAGKIVWREVKGARVINAPIPCRRAFGMVATLYMPATPAPK